MPAYFSQFYETYAWMPPFLSSIIGNAIWHPEIEFQPFKTITVKTEEDILSKIGVLPNEYQTTVLNEEWFKNVIFPAMFGYVILAPATMLTMKYLAPTVLSASNKNNETIITLKEYSNKAWELFPIISNSSGFIFWSCGAHVACNLLGSGLLGQVGSFNDAVDASITASTGSFAVTSTIAYLGWTFDYATKARKRLLSETNNDDEQQQQPLLGAVIGVAIGTREASIRPQV